MAASRLSLCTLPPTRYSACQTLIFQTVVSKSQQVNRLPQIVFVEPAPLSISTAAVAPQLSRNEKLRNVLRELRVNSLFDSTPQ